MTSTTTEGVHAYRLPDGGTEVSAFVGALDWADDDLRPADVFDACTAVSGGTLATLGLDPHEQVVGACSWGGGENLRVSVDALSPADPGYRDRTEGTEVDADEFLVTVTSSVRNVVVTVTTTVENTTPTRAQEAAEAAAEDVVAELESR